ncbi:hypothetical protein THII_1653 [Thioploca ingrica]|uniref:Polysaccharide pyruvyl transferase domain-containing protein n=1 Tax=Thioploca ingrica TaxID=40754 RepID=A0A090ALG3_9GAMM|nr:hypothetical protein THII_1653 [Thioploca ingrica]
MKYASLGFEHAPGNLGDNIQTLAVEQFLPYVDKRFPIDALNQVQENDKYLLVMNGWFTPKPQNWPPSESIVPIFFGFHIRNDKNVQKLLLNEGSINYFKCHEPIGCRDRETANMLSRKGVKTYYSKCLTLTFPKRESEPQNGKVFLVDIDEDTPIPKHLEQVAIRITHVIPHIYSEKLKFEMARQLLDLYRKEARLVITKRLHCALPCIAFGIPIVFLTDNPDDYRISLLKDLNIKIYKRPNILLRGIYLFFRRFQYRTRNRFILSKISRILTELCWLLLINRKVDWNPKPVSIDVEKEKIIEKINELIQSKL